MKITANLTIDYHSSEQAITKREQEREIASMLRRLMEKLSLYGDAVVEIHNVGAVTIKKGRS